MGNDEKQRWARGETAAGKKVGVMHVFHTGMHGAHQFPVKPINLPRVSPKTKLLTADERVSDARDMPSFFPRNDEKSPRRYIYIYIYEPKVAVSRRD